MSLSFNPIDVMTDCYLEAALWADGDENWQNVTEPTATTRNQARQRCIEFMRLASPHIQVPRDEELFQRLGHDLWLTSQGHGTGFWDRPDFYGASASEKLTELSQLNPFSTCHVYHAGGQRFGIE